MFDLNEDPADMLDDTPADPTAAAKAEGLTPIPEKDTPAKKRVRKPATKKIPTSPPPKSNSSGKSPATGVSAVVSTPAKKAANTTPGKKASAVSKTSASPSNAPRASGGKGGVAPSGTGKTAKKSASSLGTTQSSNSKGTKSANKPTVKGSAPSTAPKAATTGKEKTGTQTTTASKRTAIKTPGKKGTGGASTDVKKSGTSSLPSGKAAGRSIGRPVPPPPKKLGKNSSTGSRTALAPTRSTLKTTTLQGPKPTKNAVFVACVIALASDKKDRGTQKSAFSSPAVLGQLRAAGLLKEWEDGTFTLNRAGIGKTLELAKLIKLVPTDKHNGISAGKLGGKVWGDKNDQWANTRFGRAAGACLHRLLKLGIVGNYTVGPVTYWYRN